MPSVLEAVSVADLDELLQRAQDEGLCLVVDFWASWCGPCRMMTPLFERLSEHYTGQCLFVKVDVDKSEEVATKYAVKAMPTFLMFKGNAKVDSLVGANLNSLESMIQKQVAP